MSTETSTIVHIRPGVNWQWLGFRDVWDYRGLLWNLGLRDVKLRYKQTLLGVAWVVLQPLLSAGILTAVFGFIAAAPSPAGVPYFVFAYLGQMGWSLFGLTIARVGGSMVGNAGLVMKIYFPRAILPLSTVVSVLLDFAISFVLAVPMVIIYSQSTHLLTVLGVGAMILMFATGIGFFVASISVKFRDVLFMVPLIVQLGVYASPVAYGLEVVRDNLTRHSPAYFDIYMLNPLSPLVETFRWGLLGQGLVIPSFLVYSIVISLVTFIAGFTWFHSAERNFADVI